MPPLSLKRDSERGWSLLNDKGERACDRFWIFGIFCNFIILAGLVRKIATCIVPGTLRCEVFKTCYCRDTARNFAHKLIQDVVHGGGSLLSDDRPDYVNLVINLISF